MKKLLQMNGYLATVEVFLTKFCPKFHILKIILPFDNISPLKRMVCENCPDWYVWEERLHRLIEIERSSLVPLFCSFFVKLILWICLCQLSIHTSFIF